MNRYILTNPRFSGEVELIYDGKGILRVINFQQAQLTAAQVKGLKAQIPALAASLAVSFGGDTTIVHADFEATFDMFWKSYNKKINKKRSEDLWRKMTKPAQVAAWAGVSAYDKYLKRESWRSKADPDTYLRNRYWENEYR
jgi:hypothetical protein